MQTPFNYKKLPILASDARQVSQETLNLQKFLHELATALEHSARHIESLETFFQKLFDEDQKADEAAKRLVSFGDTDAGRKVIRYVPNGHILGEAIVEVMGDWVFYPNTGGGYWEQEVLEAIAAQLADLNAAWQAHLSDGAADAEFSTRPANVG